MSISKKLARRTRNIRKVNYRRMALLLPPVVPNWIDIGYSNQQWAVWSSTTWSAVIDLDNVPESTAGPSNVTRETTTLTFPAFTVPIQVYQAHSIYNQYMFLLIADKESSSAPPYPSNVFSDEDLMRAGTVQLSNAHYVMGEQRSAGSQWRVLKRWNFVMGPPPRGQLEQRYNSSLDTSLWTSDVAARYYKRLRIPSHTVVFAPGSTDGQTGFNKFFVVALTTAAAPSSNYTFSTYFRLKWHEP